MIRLTISKSAQVSLRVVRKTLAAMLLFRPRSAAGCKHDAPPAADVWAVVNGEQIHRAEAEKYYKSRLNPQSPTPSQEEALSLTLNVLDEIINNDILIQRAKKLGLEATDGEVEDKFTEFKSPYTEDEFQRQIKDRGVTIERSKRRYPPPALRAKTTESRSTWPKSPSPIRTSPTFYNQNRRQFNVAETQYRIAQILVTPHKDPQLHNRKNDDATTDVEARRKAAALVQQLANGADFTQLAMDYSEDPATASSGGDLGFIPESSLNQSDPALKHAVVGLKVGEISPVIQLNDGYHILKLMAKEAPGQRETFRSSGAAIDSRHLAQSQRAAFASRLYGRGARRSKSNQFPGRAGNRIQRQIAGNPQVRQQRARASRPPPVPVPTLNRGKLPAAS